MNSIYVSSLMDVEKMLEMARPSHLVSLLQPDGAQLDVSGRGIAHRWIAFSDITVPMPGHKAPTLRHIEELVEFVSDWDRTGNIGVHCWAGVSRSSAAALIIGRYFLGADSEEWLVREIRRQAPFVTPNSLMIEHADVAFGCGGKFITAVKNAGRGEFFDIGRIYSLDLGNLHSENPDSEKQNSENPDHQKIRGDSAK